MPSVDLDAWEGDLPSGVVTFLLTDVVDSTGRPGSGAAFMPPAPDGAIGAIGAVGLTIVWGGGMAPA